jgi:Transposase IS116/IS110/IS902 family
VIVMSACITVESALVLGARFLRSSGRRDALADALEFEAIAHPRFGNEGVASRGIGLGRWVSRGTRRRLRAGSASATVAAVALPALDALPGGDRGDHERGRRIGPPPAEQRVREQPHQQCDGEVGADLVLICIADRRGRAEPFADTALCPRERRLCPQVYQSGERDLRGPLTKQVPRYLRWALVEAATHACTAPVYRHRYQQTNTRIGKQRGAKVAQIDLARRLTEAKTMLTEAKTMVMRARVTRRCKAVRTQGAMGRRRCSTSRDAARASAREPCLVSDLGLPRGGPKASRGDRSGEVSLFLGGWRVEALRDRSRNDRGENDDRDKERELCAVDDVCAEAVERGNRSEGQPRRHE